MNKLAIIGMGLMGGSLGLAARTKKAVETVAAYARREETRNKALELGAADFVFDTPQDAVRDADLVVFCVPVLAVSELARACRSNLAKGSIVTDVGSTKAVVVAEMDGLLRGSQAVFIGSHPMAGSEETGLDAARANLYEGAVVALTPTPAAADGSVGALSGFWNSLGSITVKMDAAEHDSIVARTSHLPHLAAAALTASALRKDRRKAGMLCGPGFRDATRIAAGSEDVWHDILKTNARAVSAELERFIETLNRIRGLIDKGDFDALRLFLCESRNLRRDFASAGEREGRNT